MPKGQQPVALLAVTRAASRTFLAAKVAPNGRPNNLLSSGFYSALAEIAHELFIEQLGVYQELVAVPDDSSALDQVLPAIPH